MSDFQVVWVVVEIQVQNRFFKKFDVFLTIILNNPGQDSVWNLNLFKSATQNECLEIFKISLLDSSLSEHVEEFSE